MAEELQMSKEVKILQGKLDGLDVETLQQLLQAAIACKTKESSERNTFSSLSSETASVVLNQNTNGGVQENSDEVDKNSAEVVGDNGHSQLNCLDNKSSEPASQLPESECEKILDPGAVTSHSSLADKHQSLEIQKDEAYEQESDFAGTFRQPLESPNDYGNITSDQLSANLNQLRGSGKDHVTNPAQQQPNIILSAEPDGFPNATNLTKVDQCSGKIDEAPVSSEQKDLTYNTISLQSQQVPNNFEQVIQDDLTAECDPQVDKSLPFNTSPVTSKSPISFKQNIGQKRRPLSSSTENQTRMSDDKNITATDNSFSPVTVSNSDQLSEYQKPGMVGSQVHKPSKTGLDHEHQEYSMLTSYGSQESLLDFPSVVPPLLIPFSNVAQYLPDGMVILNTETCIPLSLKPMIVVKGQVAVMVFRQDDGARNACEKREEASIRLSIEEPHAIYNQQPLQHNKDQPWRYDSQVPQQTQQQENAAETGTTSRQQQGEHLFQYYQPSQEPKIHQQQQFQTFEQPRQEQQLQQDQARKEEQQQPLQLQQKYQPPQQQQPPHEEHRTLQQQQQQCPRQQQQLQQQQQQQHQPLQLQQAQQQVQQLQQTYLTSQQQHQPPHEEHRILQQQQDCRPPQQQQQQQYQPRQLQQQQQRSQQQQQWQQSFTQLSDNTHQDSSMSQELFRSSSLPHLPTAPLQRGSSGHKKQAQSNGLPGMKPPAVWMSDQDCNNCMNCRKSFSVVRRKHHCRGCGKIFCGDCCDQLAQLPYLGRKAVRICVACTRIIKQAHYDNAKRKKKGKLRSNSQVSSMSQPPPRVNHSLMYLPSDSINTPVMISQQPIPESNFNIPQETNDAYHTSATHLDNFNPFNDSTASIPVQPPSFPPGNPTSSKFSVELPHGVGDVVKSRRIPSRTAGRTVTWTDHGPSAEMSFEEYNKKFKNLNKVLKSQEGAVIQVATKLAITAKKIQVVVKKERHDAWLLCSHGFEGCGQLEITFLLEKRINEDVFPYEMVKVFRTLYYLTLNQGERFAHGNYLAFNNPLLGSEENAGFLFITVDKAPKIVRPYASGKPLLFGILLKRSELPCAKYLPTRLLNALGAQQQCFPSPALSSRDRPSVCSIEPNELFYSTFVAFNQFLNYKIPEAIIPDVQILKSGSVIVLELPFSYQIEIISVLDSLLIDESKPVAIPIAGDIVPEASGHFLCSSSNTASAHRGFVVLQNSDEQVESGNHYLAFSAILLVLTFGDACNSRTRFGIEVIEDGITVTFNDSQAREIRQAIYQGTNCAMSVGESADSKEQFSLRWTSDTSPSILDVPTPVRLVHNVKPTRKGQFPPNITSQPARQVEAGQTNVMIDRVKTRDVEAAVRTKISSEDPQKSVEKLESDVRQACAGCLLTFANRLRPNAEKRLNLTLLLGPGYHKKWTLGPSNQPINLARSLQLALNEIDVPDVNDEIVFVFNVILQKKN